MTFKKQSIAIDQDQVLASLLEAWLELYNYDYSHDLAPHQITKWNWHDITFAGERIYTYLDDASIFENLDVVKDSIEVTKELSEHFELFVVTAPWNAESVPPKSRWLQKHFPHINKKNHVFTQNKSVINCNFLIDDKPSNLINIQGQPLLFTAPHNLNEVDFPRVNNWLEVREWFLG